jgi:hypothetical protein
LRSSILLLWQTIGIANCRVGDGLPAGIRREFLLWSNGKRFGLQNY